MNKKSRIICCIALVIALWIWFFAWREYTKYQIRQTMEEAFKWFGEIFNDDSLLDDTKSEDINKEDSKQEESKSDKTIKDESNSKKETKKDKTAILKKWTTETFSWKYDWNNIEAELSLWDVAFTEEIIPPEPKQSYYTYFPKQDGKTFAVLYMNIKNIWWKTFDLSDVIRNAYKNGCSSKAIFWWKYEYTADIIAELEKDSKWHYSYDSNFIYVDPLESKEIIVAFSLPLEVKDKDAELNLCIGNQKINIDFEDKEETATEEVEEVTE